MSKDSKLFSEQAIGQKFHNWNNFVEFKAYDDVLFDTSPKNIIDIFSSSIFLFFKFSILAQTDIFPPPAFAALRKEDNFRFCITPK